jgi:alpha-tubulin suppressor-like RCC1 family protein
MQGRTALDLLSEELKVFMEHEQPGLVYSWGNGANYQLGTGATGLQAGPVRLDALRKALVVQVAAAKYHSAAVTKDGQLFTWGFGRGGRLGGCLSCDAHMYLDCASNPPQAT